MEARHEPTPRLAGNADQLSGESDFPNTESARAKQASPWAKDNPEHVAERERLIALHTEAWRYDPQSGMLKIRAISILDLEELFATRRFDLLTLLCKWTDALPALCRQCGTRVNAPDDIGGFVVTTAALALKPRFAIVSGFCHACAVHGHEAMRTSAARALQREGIVVDIIDLCVKPQ